MKDGIGAPFRMTGHYYSTDDCQPAGKIDCVMNARSLYNFFRLRCCRRAQWEIRELALKMREEVRRVAPVLFALAGPSCETEGICWEGEFSCGRAREVRSRGVAADGGDDLGA